MMLPKNTSNMQAQIDLLNNQITALTTRIMQLEAKQIAIDASPEMVKQLLNITKSQLVVTDIANPPVNSPTGSIAMQVSPVKMKFKSDTGWVTLI